MFDLDATERSKAIFTNSLANYRAPDTWGQIRAQNAEEPEQPKQNRSALAKIASLAASFYTGGLSGGAKQAAYSTLNSKAQSQVNSAKTIYDSFGG